MRIRARVRVRVRVRVKVRVRVREGGKEKDIPNTKEQTSNQGDEAEIC